MSYMFEDAVSANPDTSAWDIANVIDMRYMFKGASAAGPDASSWDTSSVLNMFYMFRNTDIGTTNYSNFLIQVEATNQNNNVELDGGNATYNALADEARQRLIDEHGWVITDG